MDVIPLLLKEQKREAQITREFLKRVPVDKFDWKPDEKSMDLRNLAVHIAEIFAWPAQTLNTKELDFAEQEYKPTPVGKSDELLKLFEESLEKGKVALEQANEDDLKLSWKLRNGDQILSEFTKYEALRHAFNQITHHRAQLGVYLRLLGIPVPGSYGPTADEQSF